MAEKPSIADRFWSKVIRGGDDDCWLWQAFRDKDGYGRFSIGPRNMSASRGAWEIANGQIPKGMHVLHTCDNPPCCNPKHLFLGTQRDNTLDAAKKGRMKGRPQAKDDASPKRQMTHCKRGHLYDESNTAWSRAGHRVCRACQRAHMAKHRAGKKPVGYKYVHHNSAKTHCKHGHPFDDANTYWYGKYRECRACDRARERRNKKA